MNREAQFDAKDAAVELTSYLDQVMNPPRGGASLGAILGVLWDASEGAGTARPHLLRTSGARKSVVAVAGKAVRFTQCPVMPRYRPPK